MAKDNYPPMVAPTPGAPAPREFDYYEMEMEERTHLKDYVHILLRRKKWVIGALAGMIALTLLVIFLMTPVYKSTTVLQITQDNPGNQINDADPLTLLKGNQDNSKFQETQYKILTSRGVAARVIESLNLEEAPEFKALREKDPTAPPEKVKSDMIDLFLKKLVVNPVKDTYLVEVSFKAEDRELAKKVTAALAREYMQLAIDSRNQSFSLVKDWLGKQLQQMADKVQQSQKKLFEFGQKHDFFALEDKDNVIIQKYIELNALLTKAQSERMVKEAQYRQIKEKGPDAPVITNNPLIVTLRQELVGQTAKVSGLDRTFLPGHPEMQVERAKLGELRGRLQGEVSRLMESVKADYEAAMRAERLLTQALEEQKTKLAHLQDKLVDFHILKRDAQTTEKLYQALLVRMGEATVASTMVASNVAVIDPTESPFEPYLPKPLLFLALGGAMGLFLGVGLAFLVEYLDNSIKSSDDVEKLVQLPSLGVVPVFQENGQKAQALKGSRLGGILKLVRRGEDGVPLPQNNADLVVVKHPRAMISEAIRHLRTSLMLSASGGPPGAIVVSSPHPGEGKSTIAINLAGSLALDGRRTVILDCDLRRPRLHQSFGVANHPGLTNYLTGDTPLEGVLKPTSVENLMIIPAGPVPPSPAELLNSQAFRELLHLLRRDFHHVIIDTPPTLGFADARVVAVQTDGVLLVAKHHSTTRDAGRLARHLFSQVHARILGMVLNQVSYISFGRYDYGYTKYYQNYYSQQEGSQGSSEAHKELPAAPLN
jgi:succinoglycan biosynthesis transport protein ExoP